MENKIEKIEISNFRQFELMNSQIELFEKNEISLHHLINNLHGLINAIKWTDNKLEENFLEKWAKLEHILAWSKSLEEMPIIGWWKRRFKVDFNRNVNVRKLLNEIKDLVTQSKKG